MIAAIDTGSNAIRMVIASVGPDRQPRSVKTVREPVRLGKDVFLKGWISEEAIERSIETFKQFRTLLDEEGVSHWRAVATSAMREARNREEIKNLIAQASGIEIKLIDGEEEARLVHLGVKSQVDLRDKLALLIDIGGGSTEITLVMDNQIITTGSFRLGAVRLLQMSVESSKNDQHFSYLLREQIDLIQKQVKNKIGSQNIDICVATGGNIESLGHLRELRLKRGSHLLTTAELADILDEIQALSLQERVSKLDLCPDRADVILPAALVLQRILEQAEVYEVVIPHVGLKEGLLLDIVRELHSKVSL